MIEVKNLVKCYGTYPAVDDISFTLEKGKVYGFLGPNGAGKSTTMNIMTGYLAATSGEVVINGYDIVADAEDAKKCIGYLPEIPPLYLDMTVEEYLKFISEVKKVKKSDRKNEIERVMEMTGITEYRKRLIGNLSKGYRQRVGLAQAVIGNPEIIILDEPTVGLDPKQIIEIRELIRKLSVDRTIILSSHILSEISAVCDHIIMIVRGHLIANDTPEALIEEYSKAVSVNLKIRGYEDEIKGALQRLDGIRELIIEEDYSENGIVSVSVIEENRDMREAIFHCLAECGLPILEMKKNEPSLEDVFLKLSAEEENRFNDRRERLEIEKMEKHRKKAGKKEAALTDKTENTASGEGEE